MIWINTMFTNVWWICCNHSSYVSLMKWWWQNSMVSVYSILICTYIFSSMVSQLPPLKGYKKMFKVSTLSFNARLHVRTVTVLLARRSQVSHEWSQIHYVSTVASPWHHRLLQHKQWSSNVPRDKSVRDLSHGKVKAMMVVHCILTTAPETYKNARSARRKRGAVPSSINHKWSSAADRHIATTLKGCFKETVLNSNVHLHI